MKTVLLFGLPDGTNIAAELEKYGADKIVATPSELWQLLSEEI